MTDTLAPEQTEYRPDDAPAGEPLRAPYPFFGGKHRTLGIVWPRFGHVVNYVEPFFGSGAVLLGCPADMRPKVETVNDVNCFVSNVWRSIRADPEAVARLADFPVIECDLHVRHRDLLKRGPSLRALLEGDPRAYDAEAAAWWVWGASAWIGSGWAEEGRAPSEQLPVLNGGGGAGASSQKGIHAGPMREPSRQLPSLGSALNANGTGGDGSRGVHAAGMRAPSARLPDLGGGTQWGTDEANARAGKGIHREAMRGPSEQLPAMSTAGMGLNAADKRTRLYDLFAELSARLRYTRVACGDFARILTPSVTYRHGLTAVFLDPPYDGHEYVYGAAGKGEPISARVRAWCIENGQRDDLRIALCGYEGEHDALEALGWEVVAWAAKGGYGNQGSGDNENKRRERIWFSPACLKPGKAAAPVKPTKRGKPANAAQTDLFASLGVKP